VRTGGRSVTSAILHRGGQAHNRLLSRRHTLAIDATRGGFAIPDDFVGLSFSRDYISSIVALFRGIIVRCGASLQSRR
jgi:hypothetical protein